LINQEHLNKVAERWPKSVEHLRKLSIIEEGSPQLVRMAHLAVVGCAKV
jgi:starch phosphorylase